MKKVIITMLFALLFSFGLYGQDMPEKVKLSGLMFGDYFYNLDNTDAAKKDLNGVQFRRIYITTDYNISDNFKTRFRLEADQSSSSLTSGGKIGVMVKDAYLNWKNIFSGSDLVFGLSPTPAFAVSESVWGYRSLEKTILDLFKVVSSRDLGIDLKGKLVESGLIKYWVKLGNNSGNAPEKDKYKRFYGMLQFKPTSEFQFTVYGDFASKPKVVDNFDGKQKSNNQFVGAVFLGYSKKENYSIGLEGFYQTTQNNYASSATQALETQNGIGISAFGWISISDKLKLVGRYDNYDPNNSTSNDATSFMLAGLDYRAAKNVSIIPNIEVFDYQNISTSDITGRVTFYYQF